MRLPLLALLALPLSGCFTTLALEGLNGPGACNPQLFAQAQENIDVIQSLSENSSPEDLAALPPPQKRETLVLEDKSKVQLWYFRTGAPRCAQIADADFTPVVIDAYGRVLGVGQASADAYRRLALRG